MKTALITGITGQDGSYLAELLLAKGYRVVGIVRRSSTTPYERIAHLVDQVELVSADLLDQTSLTDVVQALQPDEIYNLAAQSFVPTSWTAAGAHRRVHRARRDAHARGDAQGGAQRPLLSGQLERDVRQGRETPQSESTPFYPRSPYGVAKVYGHWITVNYRESFDLFAVSGILFNHESPRRGLEFVTRKITDAVARIKIGHAARAAPGQSRRAARLGLRRRLRRRHVAHAAAGRAGRLRDRHRRDVFRPRLL